MEHLQQFAGKNRSCKDGLARRRQKSMLRQQLQQEWQQQEQQMQTMHAMYKQQQQQQQDVAEGYWGAPNWHQLEANWVVPPQAPPSCIGMPAAAEGAGITWAPDVARFDTHINASSNSSRRSTMHNEAMLAPAAAVGGTAAVVPHVPAFNSSNAQCGQAPQALLQLGANAAATSAAAGAVPASACRGVVGYGAVMTTSVDQQQMQQAQCAAGGAAAPAGVVQVPASISNAELDAIIAEELQAAGLQIRCDLSTGRPTVVSVGTGVGQPRGAHVAMPPTAAAAASELTAAAAAAAAGVMAPTTPSPYMQENQAAQYAKLHDLMAELEDLKATLQQLQQAQGLGQHVGSVMTHH
jgi:hypothetical protein